MRVWASHIGVDKPVATVIVTIHGAETRLLNMSILWYFYILYIKYNMKSRYYC